MKSKSEPATNRIKRLLEILSSYRFGLYYLKVKDMVPSDFLLRMEGDKSDSHEVSHILQFSLHLLRTLLYPFQVTIRNIQTSNQVPY